MLKFLLLAAGVFTLVGGFAIFNVAKSAIHEIEAFLLFIISAVSLSGATVAEAVDRLRKDLLAARPEAASAKREATASLE